MPKLEDTIQPTALALTNGNGKDIAETGLRPGDPTRL